MPTPDGTPQPGPAPKQAAELLYDSLFGDVPADEWPAADGPNRDEEPWRWFAKAREAVREGVTSTAEAQLRQVLATPNLEARHYLQAWQALRELGIQPAAQEAKHVLGVVVEVALPQGLDVVAAYADGSARYLNQSGKVIIWENPDDSLAGPLHTLLAVGQHVAGQIGPWEGPPQGNAVRIGFLTPSGLHFGQGPMEVLWHDALAHPVLAAAQALMMALMEKTQPGITEGE